MIDGNAINIDDFEPIFDLGFLAFAFINEQFRFQDFGALIRRNPIKILLHPIFVLDGKFVGDKAPKTGDALLPVQDFQNIVTYLVEIDQAQRITLEDGFDDRHIFFAVRIDIVALVLRLDGEFAG